MDKKKLGVLGGMGPQATVLFYQRVLDFTAAAADQEHIETLILSDAKMPDRTAAILSGETAAVRERLLSDARLLEQWGACCIAVPCNTSHFFLPAVQAQLSIPIVNMVTETARTLQALGCKRVGVMATDGTVQMGLYHAACQALGMEVVTPPAAEQKLVMSLIYDEIKAGLRGSEDKFAAVEGAFRAQGCDRVVLACTELSVYKDWHPVGDYYVDAMDVLARSCVERCGYALRG